MQQTKNQSLLCRRDLSLVRFAKTKFLIGMARSSSTEVSALRMPSMIQGVWDNVREYLLYRPKRERWVQKKLLRSSRLTCDVHRFVLSCDRRWTKPMDGWFEISTVDQEDCQWFEPKVREVTFRSLQRINYSERRGLTAEWILRWHSISKCDRNK